MRTGMLEYAYELLKSAIESANERKVLNVEMLGSLLQEGMEEVIGKFKVCHEIRKDTEVPGQNLFNRVAYEIKLSTEIMRRKFTKRHQ
jgi:translation initiation factor 2 beta subunit (eIF-2beta)/eIF-5